MTHVITDDCIACGACEPQCEQGAIRDAGEKYEIDSDKCTDCGSCVDVCPVNSILKKE